MRIVAVVAVLGCVLSGCGDDGPTPTIVGQLVEAPDRSLCEPTDESFTADANGTHESDDAAYLAGASEHGIPGATVLGYEESDDSTLYVAYADGKLRAISQSVLTPVNGLWGLGGVRYCE